MLAAIDVGSPRRVGNGNSCVLVATGLLAVALRGNSRFVRCHVFVTQIRISFTFLTDRIGPQTPQADDAGRFAFRPRPKPEERADENATRPLEPEPEPPAAEPEEPPAAAEN